MGLKPRKKPEPIEPKIVKVKDPYTQPSGMVSTYLGSGGEVRGRLCPRCKASLLMPGEGEDRLWDGGLPFDPDMVIGYEVVCPSCTAKIVIVLHQEKFVRYKLREEEKAIMYAPLSPGMIVFDPDQGATIMCETAVHLNAEQLDELVSLLQHIGYRSERKGPLYPSGNFHRDRTPDARWVKEEPEDEEGP